MTSKTREALRAAEAENERLKRRGKSTKYTYKINSKEFLFFKQ